MRSTCGPPRTRCAGAGGSLPASEDDITRLRLGLEGTWREPAGAGAESEHRLGVSLGWRLEGAGAECIELRFEGAGTEAANGDAAPEHRVGLPMSARW